MRFYRRVQYKILFHRPLLYYYYKRQKTATIKKSSKTQKQQWMLNIRNSKRGLLAWESVTETICLSTKLKAVS
jgi:hypothetical protein